MVTRNSFRSALARPILWWPLASVALLPQCVEKISERCDLTLTCPPESSQTLDGGASTETNNPTTAALDAGQGSSSAPDGGSACNGQLCDGTLVCDQQTQQCVECLGDTDCTRAQASQSRPACSAATQRCVECTQNAHCSEQQPICDVEAQRCVECLGQADCSGLEPVCNLEAGQCSAPCADNSQCSGRAPRCRTDRSICVQCLSDDHCEEGLHCHPDSNQCVPCVSDSNCTGETPVCDPASNSCVSCLNDAQCSSSESSTCLRPEGTCVQCTNSTQCNDERAPRCNLATHACERCTVDSHCPNSAAHCRVEEGTCVQCLSNSDCGSSDATTALCNLELGRCVECTVDEECQDPAAPVCDSASGTCSGCETNNDCVGLGEDTSLCNADSGQCVGCLQNEQCPTADASACDSTSGTCQACAADSDCSHLPELSACKTPGATGQCVQCVNNSDCGGDTPICDSTSNQCVECVLDSECSSPFASRCSDNTCVSCRVGTNADCSGISDNGTPLGVCDESGQGAQCVECTGLQFAACGGNACDSLNQVCSSELIGSADQCDECLAGNHCGAELECVRDQFGGDALAQFRCYPTPAAQFGCGTLQPFNSAAAPTDIDGNSVDVCRIGPASSCSAFNSLGNSCQEDAQCGDSAADGLCFGEVVCRMRCRANTTTDCPLNSVCSDEVCIPQ